MSMRIPGGAGGTFKFGGAKPAGQAAGGSTASTVGAAAKSQQGEAASLAGLGAKFQQGQMGILSGSMFRAGLHKLMMELIGLIR